MVSIFLPGFFLQQYKLLIPFSPEFFSRFPLLFQYEASTTITFVSMWACNYKGILDIVGVTEVMNRYILNFSGSILKYIPLTPLMIGHDHNQHIIC